jgi:Mn2+/Fe2+ NRAMP family transporter
VPFSLERGVEGCGPARLRLLDYLRLTADLEGGAAALGLLFHAPWQAFVVPLALVLLGVLTVGGYDEVQKVLRFVLLCMLAYVVSAVLAHPDWGSVLRNTLVPHFRFDRKGRWH